MATEVWVYAPAFNKIVSELKPTSCNLSINSPSILDWK